MKKKYSKDTEWPNETHEQHIKKLQEFILKGHPESEKIKEQIQKIKEKNKL